MNILIKDIRYGLRMLFKFPWSGIGLLVEYL
jgi:hypothetical protein